MNAPDLIPCRIALASAVLASSSAALAHGNEDSAVRVAEVDGAEIVLAIAPTAQPAIIAQGASLNAVDAATSEDPQEQASQGQASQGQASRGSGGFRFNLPKPVFDDTWLSVGVGAGLVPSYGGSDDYIFFPLPLIVGRVGGVGLRPNGPGIRLDLLSPAPSLGSNQKKAVFNFGPAVRFRNDRANQIQDEVVELAEDLDVALEVGLAGGVTFSGVFNPLDSVTFNTQVSWDVLGAHDGMLIEPSVSYLRPFGPGVQLSYSVGLQLADDSFSDYYYSVTPAQSAATGLPLFTADGGLNSVSNTAILNFDLDGNALNGGLSVYTIAGYTRFVGDAANTPFTDIRGDANQFIGGVGVAYTF